MRKAFVLSLIIFLCIMVRRKPEDESLYLDVQPPAEKVDRMPVDSMKFIPRDTTPYKGNYIDI